MKKLLVVVDVQNDFVNGALGTKEAVDTLGDVVTKILTWDGDVVFTQDTHGADYLKTREGMHLPVEHCIEGTRGHDLNDQVQFAFDTVVRRKQHHILRVYKNFFGSDFLGRLVKDYEYQEVELVGLCTDICVISNAFIIQTNCPNADIVIDARCCAGTTPENHKAALAVMRSCQMDVVNDG